MIATIQPSELHGEIVAAASKSSMQRACAAALVAGGKTSIKNPGNSNDDRAALNVISALGAKITEEDGGLLIESSGVHPRESIVHCGESGLGIRMFTPLVALSSTGISITGEGSLVSRPMDFFDTVLPQLEVAMKTTQGKLPLTVKGPLVPKDITIDGSLSSQFLTGILLAYAASGADKVTVKVTNLKSKPYIDLTLSVMKAFGLPVPDNRNYEAFYFESRNFAPDPAASRVYTVEGDWSGAAFLLVAGAIAGNSRVKGLDLFSTQADKAVLQALISSGAGMSIEAEQISLRPLPLKAFHFNATDCPDLFPPLVALAAYCEGSTVIEGVERLTHKESNRALTLQEEFGKMGLDIVLQGDLMVIRGGGGLQGGRVHSRHDHRIAMALAVAGIRAVGTTIIEDAEAINKSYPDFFAHLTQLGASVKYE